MKLSECVFGLLVTNKEETEVGMIVGIISNCPGGDKNVRSEIGRAIPLVQFSEGGTRGVQPGNLKRFKG